MRVQAYLRVPLCSACVRVLVRVCVCVCVLHTPTHTQNEYQLHLLLMNVSLVWRGGDERRARAGRKQQTQK